MKTMIISILCMLPLLGTAQMPAQLTISGSSTTEVTPDITVINIHLTAIDMNYGTSVEQLQDKADDIKAFLKKKGVAKEHITAENFNIDKSYAYENRKQVFKGYNATLNIKLEFLNDNDLANKIINAIGESKADAEVSTYFRLSQELKDKVNDQLIEAAILDAKKKAKIIARTTEQELGQIVKINYGVQENVSVIPRMDKAYMVMDMEAGGAARKSLSITPQPVERSTEIIIYWMLQ